MSTQTIVEEKLAKMLFLVLKIQKRVSWAPDVIDNEHMNKKKSKCCCIYVPPRDRLDANDTESDLSDTDGHN